MKLKSNKNSRAFHIEKSCKFATLKPKSVKRIYWMVLRSYVGPLLLTFAIAVFVLLMHFIWLYVDDLVGKGLEWEVIAQLFFYASWTTVPMALPLSILLSSLMTFGNLGEHYELVAVKSAGISFWKTMRPLVITSILISIFAFAFSNNALPYVLLKQKSLLYDIKHKKLSFNIKEGEFYHDIDGYVLRVGKKDKDEKTLHDILIYDHTNHAGATKMTVAKKGVMEMSKDGNTLLLTLEDGWNYEEQRNNARTSNKLTYPMQRIHYEYQIMHFDLSGFEMNRTDEELFKSNYTMLNLDQLNYTIDSLRNRLELRRDNFVTVNKNVFAITREQDVVNIFAVDSMYDMATESIIAKDSLNDILDKNKKEIITAALRSARGQKQTIEFYAADLNNQINLLRKHEIVRHEKFTLSFACLVLFFIGAPLGSIIRKGGLGFPIIIATVLFIIFHIINMIGKKYALAGEISIWIGAWLSAVVLLPFGLFLTLKASNDSPLFDLDSWKKFGYRIFLKQKANENSSVVQ